MPRCNLWDFTAGFDDASTFGRNFLFRLQKALFGKSEFLELSLHCILHYVPENFPVQLSFGFQPYKDIHLNSDDFSIVLIESNSLKRPT